LKIATTTEDMGSLLELHYYQATDVNMRAKPSKSRSATMPLRERVLPAGIFEMYRHLALSKKQSTVTALPIIKKL